MIQSRITKKTALAACMSLLLALPVFAANPQQGTQNNMNMNNRNNMNISPGGINVSPGGINASPGGINASPGGFNMNASPGGINMQFQQNGTQQQQTQLSDAAQFMVTKGIIKGNSSGNYAMSDNVKRGDMSLMLVRAFGLDTDSETNSTESGTNSFSDVSQSSYYYSAVNTMKNLGIAQGDGQNFNPTRYMTLQEAILFVQRALDAADIDYSDTDLTAVFEDRSLSENATREDVAALLYAVLGEGYEDLFTTDSAVTASASTISYEADADTVINFDADDFNDVCEDATDGTLDYVVFSNASSALGRLYHDYTSSTVYDSKVSTSNKYYLDSDDGDALSEVTFVPNSNQSGTININYTGYDTEGNAFNGTVKLTIDAEEVAVADNITYTTSEDTAVTFDEDDFEDASQDATGETISYVKFSLPSTSYGKLYYNYTSSTDYDDKVASSYNYYYDADDDYLSLAGVTFVPKDSYTGTVNINYVGYNADGDTFTGTVKVTIE